MDESRTIQQSSSSERLLLNEFTHRVNNELAAAIGIAASEIARTPSDEVRCALARVRQSLENFARVLHLLSVPDVRTRVDGCAYLRSLCGAISASRLQYKGVQVLLVERPLLIDSEQCWRLGLIVSELVTNAVRHAFANDRGRITVDARRDESTIHCSVSDNGCGMGASCQGVGLRIIDAVLRDLRGRMQQQSGTDGATFSIAFPVADERD